MCVKGEESVGCPGARSGKSVTDQQSSFMGLWGKVGGRAKRCPFLPYSAYSGICESGGLRCLELLSQLALVVEEFPWGEGCL